MRLVAAVTVALSLGIPGCQGVGIVDENGNRNSGRIAFLGRAGAFWQVFVIRGDGTELRQITHSDVEKSRVSWFPDAESVLVNTQHGDLVRVDVETGIEIELPFALRGMLDAVISPDGRTVGFSFTQSDSRDANELWTCALDGSNLRQLTNRAGLQHFPSWGPDGATLYYLSDLGPRGSHDIWRFSIADDADERLTFGDLRYLDVAVSSRGELAYSGNQKGSFDIWLKSPGVGPTRLTDDPALDAHPSFSADGEQIVFESSRGGSLNLWRISRTGGAVAPVTQLPAPGARMPAWAPR